MRSLLYLCLEILLTNTLVGDSIPNNEITLQSEHRKNLFYDYGEDDEETRRLNDFGMDANSKTIINLFKESPRVVFSVTSIGQNKKQLKAALHDGSGSVIQIDMEDRPKYNDWKAIFTYTNQDGLRIVFSGCCGREKNIDILRARGPHQVVKRWIANTKSMYDCRIVFLRTHDEGDMYIILKENINNGSAEVEKVFYFSRALRACM